MTQTPNHWFPTPFFHVPESDARSVCGFFVVVVVVVDDDVVLKFCFC